MKRELNAKEAHEMATTRIITQIRKAAKKGKTSLVKKHLSDDQCKLLTDLGYTIITHDSINIKASRYRPSLCIPIHYTIKW